MDTTCFFSDPPSHPNPVFSSLRVKCVLHALEVGVGRGGRAGGAQGAPSHPGDPGLHQDLASTSLLYPRSGSALDELIPSRSDPIPPTAPANPPAATVWEWATPGAQPAHRGCWAVQNQSQLSMRAWMRCWQQLQAGLAQPSTHESS